MTMDIFNNYDVTAAYDCAKEFLLEMSEENGEDPEGLTEEEIWEEVGEEERKIWELNVKENLMDFFFGKTVLVKGTVERWNGKGEGGEIGDFEDLLQGFLKDCDYIRIWDKDGHLFVRGSHHDGTVEAEVLILTEKGIEAYEDWENYEGPDSELDEREFHEKLVSDKTLAGIPDYAAWEGNRAA